MSVLARWFGGSKPPAMPVSAEAVQRVRDARSRYAALWMRRSLGEGGYSDEEVEAILAVFTTFLEEDRRPTPDEIRERLIAHGLDEWDANVFAEAFADLRAKRLQVLPSS